ncbi:TonB-dependent receptor [Brevundimonas sp.]|uniref:TonB-dependent receptor n=1 Tax=Brevundimonas sp. TaxID=1871086 RepID=UPI003D0B258D
MHFKLLLATSAAAVALTAGAASAQSDQSDPGASQVDDVVVTARKREERLQDVPIAVTAVSGETLEREQINLVKDVAALTPGLNISSDAVGRAFISIRGVGTTLIDTVQPGVGIFIDGIYQPNTSYLNSPVVDVERIEVLRGPQGTLFGNNTLGGAINVVTRAPTDEFQGRATATYAGPDNYQTYGASISGPIIEGSLRGRLAASYHTQDGFSENTLAGGNARPLETQSVNGTLIWEVPQAQRTELSLNAYFNRVTGSQTAYSRATGPTDYVQDTRLNRNSTAQYDYAGVSAKLVVDLDARTTMTGILAYDSKEGQASGDGDFGPVPIINVVSGHNDRETYTGEVRFDTAWSDRFSTLIGVFANESTSTDDVSRTIDLGLLLGIAPGGAVVVPSVTTQTDELQSQAIYANAFYDLTDTLELSAGIRFDHQEVNVTGRGEYTADEWQPRVTLAQHWTPNHTSYASIARGFRGGGANTPGAPNPFWQGDSVWTYEIGDKFTNDSRTLTVNTAVYYNDYSHYIGQNSLTPALVAVNLNTGDVEAYGVEVEGVWTPNETFQLRAGGTYNHARITDDSEYRAVIGTGLATDRILFQPDWQGFLTASLTYPVGSGELRTDLTASYKGERVGSSLSPTFAPTLDGYTVLNANVAYQWDNYTVAVFATNLLDEDYYDSYLDKSLLGAFGFPAAAVSDLGIMGDGRRVGLRLNARF